MKVWEAAAARLRKNPLWLVLPLQASLLIWNLDLLPAWTDEDHTLQTVRLKIGEITQAVAEDIHPPLYFWLARGWVELPMPGSAISRLRALSGLWALAATAVLWRLWLRGVPERARWWWLTLWSCSPCLLLYGRMARSYSMQVALGSVALWAALGWLARPSDWRKAAWYVAAGVALLYTHYLAGLAVVGATGAVMAWRMLRGRGPQLAAPVLAHLGIALAMAPWLAELAGAINKWVAHAPAHRVLPQGVLDQGAKLGYWFVSFSFGESLPGMTGAAALVLGPALLWMGLRGAGMRPGWLPVILAAALLGAVGVSRWVSVPFVPARLLFLLPFYLLAVVLGCGRSGRAGTAVCAAWLSVTMASVIGYYGKEGFLNKSYVAPFDEIAELIRRDSLPSNTLVIVDTFNTDAFPLKERLRGQARVVLLRSEEVFRELDRLQEAGDVKTIWHVRNTHDISPGALNRRLEARLGAMGSVQRHLFVRYSATEKLAMRVAGWEERPTHFYQALEVRKRADGRGARPEQAPR